LEENITILYKSNASVTKAMAQAVVFSNSELEKLKKYINPVPSAELFNVITSAYLIKDFTTQSPGRCIHIIHTILREYKESWTLENLHKSINTTIKNSNEMEPEKSKELNLCTDNLHATSMCDKVYKIEIPIKDTVQPIGAFSEVFFTAVMETISKLDNRIVLSFDFTYKNAKTQKIEAKGHSMGLVKLPKCTTAGVFYIDPNHPRIEFVTDALDLYKIVMFSSKLFYQDERYIADSIVINKLIWLSYSKLEKVK